jgi:DNA-directed RNA polymerase subunit H (RpoH/RPB5)|tara:strand:+ start:2421 stop:2645 length:225 start_codon:yes stop_codon:yes gene_type:complete
MELSRQDKVRLAKVIDESTLKTLKMIARELNNVWSKDSVIKETEHGTVVASVRKEERANALKLYLSELERLAHE